MVEYIPPLGLAKVSTLVQECHGYSFQFFSKRPSFLFLKNHARITNGPIAIPLPIDLGKL